MKRTFIALLTTMAIMLSSGAALAAEKKNIIIPGGTMGGSMYTTVTLLTNVLNKYVPELSVSARASGTKENIFQLKGKEVEFATASGFDYWSATGEDPTKAKDVCTAVVVYQQFAPIVVQRDSAINTAADLKGKRINLCDRRTGSYTVNTHLLEVIGLTEKDIVPFYLSSSAGSAALTESRVDSVFFLTALPAPAMSLVTNSAKGGKFIPLSDAQLDALVKKYPFYSIVDVPAERMPDLGVKGSAKVPSYGAELLVGADVPEDLVYKVVKATMEHKDELIAGMASLSFISPESTVKYAGMPLHPGAQRYFREIGALK
ncbi:TAXI family TRAP transporter solute-binding subunit [Desulfovibrio sp. OttesenSCG-928-O18]|nr:TAXI family TRAP transporter solute-binding subunit [Desulfovibrio sp. OttesenSCG-928-O18]